MWYTPYEVSTRRKLGRYFLWVLLVFWVLVSFVLCYFYLLHSGSQRDIKGGTFVEGIFNEVSYLPYLKTDDQSSFYQNLLFRSCLNPYEFDENGQYAQDLCKVYTEDNQLFILKIIDDSAKWSDGIPVTIDDVFFTYDQVLRSNMWGLISLNARGDLSISLEDGKIYVKFSTMSDDNIRFFTNPILPKHLVNYMDLQSYKNTFSVAPVTDGCASIVSQVKDVNSLVFDLNSCSNTKFSYYQVKSFSSFDDFDRYLGGVGQKAIIDAYNSEKSVEGFSGQKVLTSNLFGVFFNTDSNKLNVRLRRSIGGLLYDRFFTGEYVNFIDKYDGDFINYFVSSGENVLELLERLSFDGEEGVDANDLKDSGAKELPSSISINGVDRKFVFFLQNSGDKRTLDIKFSNEFSDIKIYSSTNNSVWSQKGYKSGDKKVSFPLLFGDNLKVGANNFTISGFIKNKTYTIASIDIYVFDTLDVSKSNNWKLEILYFNDLISSFVVQQIEKIFSDIGIIKYFDFQPVLTIEELEGKLLMGTYDIYLGKIDLGTKKDILSLFGTEDPLKNPARYRNPRLSSLISQFHKSNDFTVKNEINSLLAQEMPLIFLGNTYDIIQLQNKIKADIFEGNNADKKVYSYKWRYDVFSKYSIVHSVRLDANNSLSLNNFLSFMRYLLDVDNSDEILTGKNVDFEISG